MKDGKRIDKNSGRREASWDGKTYSVDSVKNYSDADYSL